MGRQGGFLPLWTLAVSRKPVAEIIDANGDFEWYRINLINDEFFFIQDNNQGAVYRIADGLAKKYKGKVKIYQYMADKLNPIDVRIIPEVNAWCKKHRLTQLLPIMLESNQEEMQKVLGKTFADELIKDPLPSRPTLAFANFKSVDPVHIYNFYVTLKNAGKQADKLKSHKIAPKMEAKFALALILGGAVAIVVIGSFLLNSGVSLDAVTPKFLKGEFILGIKSLFHNFL